MTLKTEGRRFVQELRRNRRARLLAHQTIASMDGGWGAEFSKTECARSFSQPPPDAAASPREYVRVTPHAPLSPRGAMPRCKSGRRRRSTSSTAVGSWTNRRRLRLIRRARRIALNVALAQTRAATAGPMSGRAPASPGSTTANAPTLIRRSRRSGRMRGRGRPRRC